MEENKVNSAEPMNENLKEGKALPVKPSIWTKVKSFLCQDITIELTPRQEKIFKEVNDFWHQEITGQDVHDVLFHEITWQSTKDFWLKKVDITL